MPDVSDIFNIQNKHLVGRLIVAERVDAVISDISMPNAEHILVLSGADLKENRIRVGKVDIPVLSDEKIVYRRQPVLAVFAQDNDTLASFCSKINIVYTEGNGDSGKVKENSATWSAGEFPETETGLTVISSKFHVKSFEKALLPEQRVLAREVDGKLHIKIASQWPAHVKKSIAWATGMKEEDVIIHEGSVYSPDDQLLFWPSFAAVIAAQAAIRSGRLIEFNVPMLSIQPDIMFEISTGVSNDGQPVFQRTHVDVDLGAFPHYTAEYARSVVAGCIPIYHVPAQEVTIDLYSSSRAPGVFFGDLGYSMALAAVENHYSHLAGLTSNPQDWKIEHSGAEIESVRQSDCKDMHAQVIRDCADASSFSRLYAAYSQKDIQKSYLTPMFSYSRGVGLAAGDGIQGFSSKNGELFGYSARMTLTEDNKVVISGSLAYKKAMVEIVKGIVHDNLGVPMEDIVFENLNEEMENDLGPYTLSRTVSFFPYTVEKACKNIILKKGNGAALPLSEKLSFDKTDKNILFASHSCGAVSLELEVDPLLFELVIRKACIRLSVGKVYDLARLEYKAKQELATIVRKFFPCSDKYFDVDIVTVVNPEIRVGSVSSLIRGLTISAACRALGQALGCTVSEIPVTLEDIERETSNARTEDK